MVSTIDYRAEFSCSCLDEVATMRMMNVVHLTEGLTDGDGGSISLYRLHRGLKAAGIGSKLLCTVKMPKGAPEDIMKVDFSRAEAKQDIT